MNIIRLPTGRGTDLSPSPAGSGEVVLADSGHLFAVYRPIRTALDSPDVAVATFVNYAQMTFGYPNDEASEGIFPGLAYGFYEVFDSDWNEQLTEQNRITFSDQPNAFNRRHFLMACHETTLQVLASDLIVESFDEPFADVATRIVRRLDGEDYTVTPGINEDLVGIT